MSADPLIQPRFRQDSGQFIQTLARPAAGEETSQVTPEVTPQAVAEVSGEVTPEVTPEVVRLIHALDHAMLRREIQEKLYLKDDEHFRKSYLLPAIQQGLVEMTNPEKPRSSRQRHRLTRLGDTVRERAGKKSKP